MALPQAAGRVAAVCATPAARSPPPAPPSRRKTRGRAEDPRIGGPPLPARHGRAGSAATQATTVKARLVPVNEVIRPVRPFASPWCTIR
jgi:hypothetical protein